MLKNIITTLFICLAAVSISYAQSAGDMCKKAWKQTRAGDHEGALITLDEAIEKYPDETNCYVDRLYVLYRAGYQKEIGPWVDSMFKWFPDAWRLYLDVGNVYNDFKEFDKEVDLYKQALSKFKNEHDSVLMKLTRELGYAKSNIMDYAGAKTDFLWAYARDTADVYNHFGMAYIYGYTSNLDSAIYFYQKVLVKLPYDISTYLSLGFDYNEAGRFDDALLCYDKAFKIIKEKKDKPDYIHLGLLYSNYGYALFKKGRYKDAMDSFNTSIKHYPSNSYVYKNRALLYITQHKFKEACDDLNRATSLGFFDQYGDEVDKLAKLYCK